MRTSWMLKAVSPANGISPFRVNSTCTAWLRGPINWSLGTKRVPALPNP